MLVGRSISYVRDTANLGGYDDYMTLCGQIEMLGIRYLYCETSTLNNMANELNGLTRINLYDDFGMLKKKEPINKNEEILSNTYSYKTRSNTKYISKQVAKEAIKTKGSTLTTRNYTLDKLGNVTGISDSYFGSHTYQYDSNGNLMKVDGVDYAYDSNGNISQISKTTTTTTTYYETYIGPNGEVLKRPVFNKETKTDIYSKYTYDSTIKDRLIKVNDKTITYDSNNPLNPISYNGNTYEYEGRRLIKFNNVKYTYDLEGKRIKKDNNGNITNYYYSGDRLITEINNSYRLDYIYDENSQLIGFIHDSNKYLYIRDVLQNILGIIDINGNVVVKYDCDAFGKINNITGSKASTIGKYNPFRYKGYYYDEESSMYYCKSRYYVPEWCRWLNVYTVKNILTTRLSQFNLFGVSYNDPINVKIETNDNKSIFVDLTVNDIHHNTLNYSNQHNFELKSSIYTHSVMMSNSKKLFGGFFGKIMFDVTYTHTTITNPSNSTIYSYSDFSKDGVSYGVGINITNDISFDTHINTANIGVGSSANLGNVSIGSEISIKEGISISVGINNENSSDTATVNVGWGSIALSIGTALMLSPIPGGRIIGGLLSIFSFCI